ncbi:MAG: zeta toxin family protein [Neisseria sp.]|nr:zeta toxin family protein [Neisseria sp.]
MSHEQELRIFQAIWQDLTDERQIVSSSTPKGFVLGGQPGAGKSNLTRLINTDLNGNLLVINGDEFRRYHPDFEEIQEKYGKDAPKYTAEFAGKMTGLIIEKALKEHYNISVEGTFRTAETPLKTLDDMRRHGYETSVYIQTTPSEISWQSTLDRYEQMKAAGEAPRYTDKAHHDLVVENLPKNADIVFSSGKADRFVVYSRESLLFDSQTHQGKMPSKFIENELHRISNSPEYQAFNNLEKKYQLHQNLLSPFQKQVASAALQAIANAPLDTQIQAKTHLYTSQLSEIQQKISVDEPEIER